MLIRRVQMHGCKNMPHIYQVYLMLTTICSVSHFYFMEDYMNGSISMPNSWARNYVGPDCYVEPWLDFHKYDENDLLGQLKSNPSPFLRNISLESMTEAEGKCCIWNITIQNIKINEKVFSTFHHNSAQHFQPNGAKSIFQMFSVTRSSKAVQS